MKETVYLAWRYLRHNAWRTALLTASITLILFLPASLYVLVGHAANELTGRAERTPLLLGARGSTVDLALSSLYFRAPSVPPIPWREAEAVAETGFAAVIPLHLRFMVADWRVVGTAPEYFSFRELRVAEGRSFAILGEAVLGARAAEALGVGVGDAVISTPSGAFDVAGSFPLRMNVVGILAPAGTPDDDAVFVDIKTAWAIEGIAHGHENVATTDTVDAGGTVVADPTLLPYTEVTPENLASFHFHGDPGTYPIDAAILVPADTRAGVMLRGRYPDGEGEAQVVEPLAVVDDLVETMFSVRDAALAVSAGLAVATVLTAGLVFTLALRLRRREIETMQRIGASRVRLRAILALEVGGVVFAALLLAGLLTTLATRFGDTLLHWLAA